MNRTLRISPIADISSFLADRELVAFNVGPDGLVYLVIAMRPLDYRIETPTGFSFAKTLPDQPQTYPIVALSGGQTALDVVIDGERFNIHDVQPLFDDLLLVCLRSYFRGPDDFEKNGRVYTRGGQFSREILLGDGIQSVQTTLDGLIWTSFF